jgi:hypothetical protein
MQKEKHNFEFPTISEILFFLTGTVCYFPLGYEEVLVRMVLLNSKPRKNQA